jgi:hypothetical protein
MLVSGGVAVVSGVRRGLFMLRLVVGGASGTVACGRKGQQRTVGGDRVVG